MSNFRGITCAIKTVFFRENLKNVKRKTEINGAIFEGSLDQMVGGNSEKNTKNQKFPGRMLEILKQHLKTFLNKLRIYRGIL